MRDPQLETVRRALEASKIDAPLSQAELATSYLRRIHWWIRLVGVVWLVGVLFGVAFVVTMAITTAAQAGGS